MTDSRERARSVLEAAGIPPGRPAHVGPLGGGAYHTVAELRPTDGGHHTGGAPRIGSLIDGERMFRGGPRADFVSPALLGDIEKEEPFPEGCRGAGGHAVFAPSARLRLAPYRACLSLIMLVETVPRAYGAERDRRLREAVDPELLAAPEEIESVDVS
ncbi:hypothetical protein [Streptomyces rishiriensis]|uniref:Uncharacterized protein n=1 Tax=Streptomyces rishiriensis TaxID=68264 RepID=A0ABU0P0P8_STRRH|nr:hypothetical protein [Streptomyces rishiriensis]MDQ0584929.1 hypothetical protein [Streptomyces rishiriensis]